MKGLIEKTELGCVGLDSCQAHSLIPTGASSTPGGAVGAPHLHQCCPDVPQHWSGMVPTTCSLKQEHSFPFFVSMCVDLYVRQCVCVYARARERNISCRHVWVYKAVSYISRFQSYQHL